MFFQSKGMLQPRPDSNDPTDETTQLLAQVIFITLKCENASNYIQQLMELDPQTQYHLEVVIKEILQGFDSSFQLESS